MLEDDDDSTIYIYKEIEESKPFDILKGISVVIGVIEISYILVELIKL